jgi:hypothetical protein
MNDRLTSTMFRIWIRLQTRLQGRPLRLAELRAYWWAVRCCVREHRPNG